MDQSKRKFKRKKKDCMQSTKYKCKRLKIACKEQNINGIDSNRIK